MSKRVKKKASGALVAECMLSYGTYVAEDRALSSMWDGLKPVQRRLLWTGWERLGLRPGGNNKACARVVGDCVGCFVGDTPIPLLNGTSKTLIELATDPKYRRPFWVYSEFDGHIVPGLAHSPRLTRYTRKLAEVTLASGATFQCTVDHLWKKLDGSYCSASKLKPNDSLMPLTRRLSSGKWDGYEIFKHPWACFDSGRTKTYTHRYIADYFGIADKDQIVHHCDGNKRNNDPFNLEGKSRGAHSSEHWVADYEKRICTLRERARDPEVRKKRSSAAKKRWASASDEDRARARKSWYEHIVPYTQTKEHKRAKRKLLKLRNADPEFQQRAFEGKILKFAKQILDQGDSLTEETWIYHRKRGKKTPKFPTALKVFGSVQKLTRAAKSYTNDSVSKIRIIKLKKELF